MSLRTLTDRELDGEWNAAIKRGDSAMCQRYEIEFRRRSVAGSGRSPLLDDLETRLAERAGKPMSRPDGKVNYGNPAVPGEKDPINE